MVKMKDSGIEWIGEIPEKWKTVPIYTCTSEITQKNFDLKEKRALKFTYGNIVDKNNFNIDEDPALTQTASNYLVVKPNDIVINGLNLNYDFVTQRVGMVNNNGIITSAYIGIRPNQAAVIPKYLLYLFKTYDAEKAFHNMGGGVRKILNYSELKKEKVILPSVVQQRAIIEFLDKKCTEINDLSNQVKKEINALQKYRKAVITKAVTKGVNASLPMKNSGIEWLGNISNEAIVTKLKFILTSPMKYGANEAGIEYSSELPRYIRITDITTDSKLKKNNKLSLSKEQAREYILKDKTILFARSGGTVGKTFFYRENMGLAAFAGYLISANVDEEKACPEFVYYYTQSSPYEKWKDQIFSQATIQNIGADRYSNMPIPIFKKIDYQKKIVSYLNSKTKQIDKVIQLKQNQLALLSNYKNSLIFEYVTGKK